MSITRTDDVERLFTLSIMDHSAALEASMTVAERDAAAPRVTAIGVSTTITGGGVTADDAQRLLARLGIPLSRPVAEPSPLNDSAEEARGVARPPWAELRAVYVAVRGEPARIAEHFGAPAQQVYYWLQAGRRAGQIPKANGKPYARKAIES